MICQCLGAVLLDPTTVFTFYHQSEKPSKNPAYGPELIPSCSNQESIKWKTIFGITLLTTSMQMIILPSIYYVSVQLHS